MKNSSPYAKMLQKRPLKMIFIYEKKKFFCQQLFQWSQWKKLAVSENLTTLLRYQF